ncbi:heat shock protein GrpE [Nonlabens tegetincola]|uniref:Protein GrpE n=1 Tax=Nonlabens tegetincola TaxID=323273 RepID=A0A090QPQ4_9FLAO|nr:MULTISPECIES: nucleotide exchange factor GrpE [Nonlabens]ALM20338.1 molecular chaperone GrpE [Nonlabens sp. MIC269]ARN70599.1 nucleotide exchange factor GrpE [Nonlabens tegetincola]MEE2801496.1 nucleotide exchange factor GrpE [Bacteroidota bacterium]GAK97456.1 heat shock protein GrpE [Nonlabens tegetincola]
MAKDKQQQEEVEQEVLHNTEEQDVAQEQDQSEEKTELEKVQEELQAEKDRYLRLFAEFENYKRRTAKERVELFKTAGEGILKDMLPVLDDFDRALVEINKSDDEQLTAGVTLISNKLRNTLKSKNLEEVEVEAGDTFNADDHEAVTQIPAPNDDMKGKIIDVIEKGYKLGDKVIRYPKVVIGK